MARTDDGRIGIGQQKWQAICSQDGQRKAGLRGDDAVRPDHLIAPGVHRGRGISRDAGCAMHLIDGDKLRRINVQGGGRGGSVLRDECGIIGRAVAAIQTGIDACADAALCREKPCGASAAVLA